VEDLRRSSLGQSVNVLGGASTLSFILSHSTDDVQCSKQRMESKQTIFVCFTEALKLHFKGLCHNDQCNSKYI